MSTYQELLAQRAELEKKIQAEDSVIGCLQR
jgi:hypothetical protein